MYQFYYADMTQKPEHRNCQLNMADRFTVTAVRPAMWEEHCLECAAPLCFKSCVHYQHRSDGRCKRFANGIAVYPEEKACCGEAAHIKFRKWANLMTIQFPAMLPVDAYQTMTEKNRKLGKGIKVLNESPFPEKLRWTGIRTAEWLRRRHLRKLSSDPSAPTAFLFHGYSYMEEPFRLILEIYDDHTSVYRTALLLQPGENLHIIPEDQLPEVCRTAGYLLKIYPENDLEGEMDLLWCDFVRGFPRDCQPAATVKCVIWDLDHTVWDGILIETDDPHTLRLKEGVLDTIRLLDERGVIQSIASKNDSDATLPLLEEMGILSYFLYPQIHWNAKSESVAAIAKSLNIGIDACALIDDSPFERNEVQAVHPQVRVYDPAILQALPNLPEFQLPITEESRQRRKLYQAEEKRMQVQQKTSDSTVEFLKKCHLQTTIFTPSTEEEITRCYELISRTNQLNMSGKKYTTEEFREVLARPDHRTLAFSCRDDFGSYGTVGFMQYRINGDNVVFTEFAMSCRVAGKYVESAVFSWVLEDSHRNTGILDVIITPKNSLLRQTLEDIGFTEQKRYEHHQIYTFQKGLKHQTITTIAKA